MNARRQPMPRSIASPVRLLSTTRSAHQERARGLDFSHQTVRDVLEQHAAWPDLDEKPVMTRALRASAIWIAAMLGA